ncbi:MAG TPA: dienelactone hydrolase family protein [Sphingobium sp.]|nr:dienelactone hydrolase family protein [Sphingobium sp.]
MNSTTKGQRHVYRDGDVELIGEIYRPSREPNGRAMLVVHEADGIGGNVRRHCDMLADDGYFVLAADMHGGGRVLQGDEMFAALQRFRNDPPLFRQRVRSGFDELLAISGIEAAQSAAIGFCFGGFAALELARSGAPVAAVGSFHGLLTTNEPARPEQKMARIAVFHGDRDPLVPPEDVAAFEAEMRHAQADWQLTNYGQAFHSFTNEDVGSLGDPRMRYDRAAHLLSWKALKDFLDISLSPSSPG